MAYKKAPVPGKREMLLLQERLIDSPAMPDSTLVEFDYTPGAGATVSIAVRDATRPNKPQIVRIMPMRNDRYKVSFFDTDGAKLRMTRYIPGDVIDRLVDAVSNAAVRYFDPETHYL